MAKKDPVQEILEYMKKNLNKGYSKESLKWALVNQGYSKMEIEKAFKSLPSTPTPKINKEPEQLKEVLIEKKEEPVVQEKKSFWKRMFG